MVEQQARHDMHVWLHGYMYVHVLVCVCVYIYIYVLGCTCVHVRVGVSGEVCGGHAVSSPLS